MAFNDWKRGLRRALTSDRWRRFGLIPFFSPRGCSFHPAVRKVIGTSDEPDCEMSKTGRTNNIQFVTRISRASCAITIIGCVEPDAPRISHVARQRDDLTQARPRNIIAATLPSTSDCIRTHDHVIRRLAQCRPITHVRKRLTTAISANVKRSGIARSAASLIAMIWLAPSA